MSSAPIVVVGSGPAGLATALALRATGRDAIVLEKRQDSAPAGAILNLWPPVIKALRAMNVDTDDIGLPCRPEFRRADDRLRARIHLPDEVEREYGGAFIGMLRPDLTRRLLNALDPDTVRHGVTVDSFTDTGEGVDVRLSTGETVTTPLLVGADGIHSTIRTALWGAPDIRDHRLHVIGGYTFDLPADIDINFAVLRHTRTVQGSYSGMSSNGTVGAEWWFVEAWPTGAPAPTDLHAHVSHLARAFPKDLQQLVANTDPTDIVRWPIRDLGAPPKTWSKGAVTLVGDAIHATSPYAAYGAGMSIIDGYFLAQSLTNIDVTDRDQLSTALTRYDSTRVAHTSEQVALAYALGQAFHHTPGPLRPLRDLILDHTPLLQRQAGSKSPAEIAHQIDAMGDSIFNYN